MMEDRPSTRSDYGFDGRSDSSVTGDRAQTTLVVTAVGLVLLTAALAASLAVADRAFAAGTRQPEVRHAAVAAADRLVAADSPYTTGANVLDADGLAGATAADLRRLAPPLAGRPFEIRLDGQRLVGAGDPTAVAAVERIVLLERAAPVRLTPRLSGADHETTLPRRTRQVRIAIEPPAGSTVRRVRANGRVVLSNASGLDGSFVVRLSPHATVSLAFEASGPLPRGAVQLTYRPLSTTKGRLTVVVGRG